jgi:hypothetical protein
MGSVSFLDPLLFQNSSTKIPYTGMKVILKFADDTACALLHGRDKNAALLMQRAELSPLCHARPRAGKPPQRAREGGSKSPRRGREAAGSRGPWAQLGGPRGRWIG